jgi:glucokinase
VNALAADIGGTSLRAALVGGRGEILARREAPTPEDPRAGVALLRALWEELGKADARGAVVAGGIRPGDGEITQSPNLPRWEGVKLGRELSCVALNDANGAALGEAWAGGLLGTRSAILLTLGTGVGGGLILDGKLWEGATGCSGELGHVAVRPEGPPCGCGSTGCLETYASASAVARAAGAPDALEAARRARAGDARARAAFDAAADALGVVLAGLVNALNPEAIALGGGMAGAFDLLAPRIEALLAKRAFRLAREGLRLVPATLGNDAGLIGAARAALLRQEAGDARRG